MPKRSRSQTRLDTGGAESVTDAAYDALRQAILAVDLRPGAALPITALRRRYPYGPTPLREALSRLSGEGLVTLSAQRGFRVAPASADHLHALRMQSAQLEPVALRAAVAANDPTWRAELAEAYAAFAPHEALVGDTRRIGGAWEQLHRRFHLALLAGCGSPALLAHIATLYDQMNRYRRLALPNLGYASHHRPEHEELCRVALSGDPDAAAALLSRHLDATLMQIASMFAGEPEEDEEEDA